MRIVALSIMLFLATLAFAQQQPPSTSPPYQTPPTLPGARQIPREQLPPDMEGPSSETMSADRVQQQIMLHLGSEPTLVGTNVNANVNDDLVVLTGSVNTQTEHDVAVRIAQSYAGDRKVIDKIQIQHQT
jgi:osmotically-inducible protein OsmY